MIIKQLENIIEITITAEENKYMLIFPSKNKAIKYSKKIESHIKEKLELDEYLDSLNYKVSLGQEDLLIINEAAREVPPIYKVALQTGVDRVILFT